jgi:membrane protease YdiL (CAAX protease family)
VATSVVFAVLHVPPWDWTSWGKVLSFAAYCCAGASFAGVALWTGRLWPAIAFHTGYNAILTTGDMEGSITDTVAQRAPGFGYQETSDALPWLAAEATFAIFVIWRWRKTARARASAATPA